MELGHEKKWRKIVNDELFSTKELDAVSSWYHIIIFCIGANSRVQDFELNLIDEILNNKYGVIIALTKADLATEDELSTIREDIEDHFEDSSLLNIIPVCSVQRRNNRLEGKEEIAEAIIESWEQTLINRLPEHVFCSVYDNLQKWFEETSMWLSNQKIGLFHKSRERVLTEMNTRIQSILKNTNRIIKTRQNKAIKEISEVNAALGHVVDLNSIASPTSSLALKLERLDNSFVFDDKKRNYIAVAGEIAALSIFLPVIGTIGAVGFALASLASLFGTTPQEKLQSALTYQYKTIFKLYSEREIMYEYVLADSFGYYYGTREVAIGALKGRGIEKSTKLFSDKIKAVEEIISEYDLEDGRAEYYLAYYYYSSESGNSRKSQEKAKRWLKLSNSHDYPAANAVYGFGDVFNRMIEQEEKEYKEYYDYWYGE